MESSPQLGTFLSGIWQGVMSELPVSSQLLVARMDLVPSADGCPPGLIELDVSKS